MEIKKEKKLTKKDLFNMALEIEGVANEPLLVEFFNKEIELLNRKNSNKSMTPTQKENVGLKEIILDILSNSETPLTISEITFAKEELRELSNQKISSLLGQLVKENKVERIPDKKKITFAIVK